MAKKQKLPKSHVKRLKLYQAEHPMSQAQYQKKLHIARRKNFFRIFWRVILIVVIALVVIFLAANFWLYRHSGMTLWGFSQEAKEIVEESSPEDFIYAESSFVYSADGTRLAELSEDTDATFLSYDEIPSDVVDAFVSVEDRSFWTNDGVDYSGIARVILNYIRTRGEVVEGASTITQQLARNTFLTNDKTIERKIEEIFIAREMTKKYSKEEIMAYYCNTCCFANGIYGVEDAAQQYFGRSVQDLTLSEMAYLCAIPNRPEYYNPLKEPQNAISRRDKILGDMVECGYITESESLEAQSQSIKVAEVETDDSFYNYEVTYAIYCAVRYFMKMDGFEFQYEFESDEEYQSYLATYDEYYAQAKHKLYTGGYEVETSISLSAQEELQEILDEQLDEFDEQNEEGIDDLQGAVTVINNETGKVTAIIGGRSQNENEKIYSLNRAYQSYAQPGSSFKPLAVYTPALDNGYDAYSVLKNIDVEAAMQSTTPEISEMSGSGVYLINAVEQSLNGCACWLFNEIGVWKGLSYVQDMNFARIMPEDYNLSAALGGLTYGVTTVEMANAYYTLENHGVYTQTDCIEHIYDNRSIDIYENPESKIVYSAEAADEMTDILKGVLTAGTASSSDWYSYTETEAAGKTGTTNDNKAGWFCGYTPYYTIAVWVGCDNPKPVEELQGATYPLGIWEESMLDLMQDLPTRSFEKAEEEEEEDYSWMDEVYNNASRGSSSESSGGSSEGGGGTESSWQEESSEPSWQEELPQETWEGTEEEIEEETVVEEGSTEEATGDATAGNDAGGVVETTPAAQPEPEATYEPAAEEPTAQEQEPPPESEQPEGE